MSIASTKAEVVDRNSVYVLNGPPLNGFRDLSMLEYVVTVSRRHYLNVPFFHWYSGTSFLKVKIRKYEIVLKH